MIRTIILTILIAIIIFLIELIVLRGLWIDLMIPVFNMPELTTWQFIEFVIFIRVLTDGIFKRKERNVKKEEK